jgi:hypothetical protein
MLGIILICILVFGSRQEAKEREINRLEELKFKESTMYSNQVDSLKQLLYERRNRL